MFKFNTKKSKKCSNKYDKYKLINVDKIKELPNQWGIKTNSGIETGKLYIVYPYNLSNKYKMRKNFKFNGTIKEKNLEIFKIKSTPIYTDLKFLYSSIKDHPNCLQVTSNPIKRYITTP